MDICYWWAPMGLGPSGFLCAGPSAMFPSWPPKAAIPSQLNCSSGNDCSQHTSNFISELLLASLPTMVRSASACSCNNASEHPEMAYCCGGDASVMLSSAMVIWPLFLMGTKEVLCSHLLYTSQRNQLLFFFLPRKEPRCPGLWTFSLRRRGDAPVDCPTLKVELLPQLVHACIASICCWETVSWNQVIKLHFCFQWHWSSEGDWQLCEWLPSRPGRQVEQCSWDVFPQECPRLWLASDSCNCDRKMPAF